MRALWLLLATTACNAGAVHPRHGDAGADVPEDAGPALAIDSGVPGTDSSVAIAPDAGPPPAPDAGPSCVPTRTTCNTALECGAIPNGCPGGAYDCGECGGGETYCAQDPGGSAWTTRVYNCMQAARAERPEWFDGDLVVEASAPDYVAYMASCSSAGGAYCIVDSNAPANEIRCRADGGDLADNFSVRTYGGGGRAVARYTSGCTPAFF